MLCKDRKAIYSCQVEIENNRIVVKTSRAWRYFRIESIEDLVLDEISGKLTIRLINKEVVEIQPQTVGDRDTISCLLVLLTVASNQAIFDSVSDVLKAFYRAAVAIIKLFLVLSSSIFINWRKLSEVSKELADVVKLGRGPWTSAAREEIERVLESVSHRDTGGLVRNLKNAVVSLYESTKLNLARVLPGSSSEVLLDLVLASALNSVIRYLDTPLPEKEAVNPLLAAALKRFSKVFSIGDTRNLEALLFSTHSSEEFIDKLLEELKKNLALTSTVLQKQQ
ncbi:MAG: hypothetical protein RMH84_03330 [Sulfolobales archaeon]|nr:hypothetical protein [Sulfolobales archaeon]MCX8208439.1 hypothetical protein [Sulfolobales archaeon]MDW8010610.1 hypothetical protein [Sulfolobales archaeon]